MRYIYIVLVYLIFTEVKMDAIENDTYIKGQLFVISGPSGVGKTVLTNTVLSEYGDQYNIRRVVTYTTRAPRLGEVDGVDYNFVTKEYFEDLIYKGMFLEWNKWGDNYYGTSSELIEQMKSGVSYIIILDRNGARTVSKEFQDAHLIWIEVPSMKILEERLCNRGDESAESIQKRLKIAEKEIHEELEERLYPNRIKNLYLKDSIAQLLCLIQSKIRSEI